MPEEIGLQDLLDFSVKVLNKSGDPVGTGIVISPEGQILTCAHVLRAVGVEPRKAKNKTINIHFPQVRGGEEKKRKARVKTFLPKHEDDIVVLELTDGKSPLAPEQIARLGTAEGSEHHEFRSYGFSSIGSYLARYAEGRIMGPTEVVETKLLAKPIELRTRDIRPGLSGAGVLDVKTNRIIGLVTERWNPVGNTENDNIGWATDTVVLTFSPFDFDLQSTPYPKRKLPSPIFDAAETKAAFGPIEKYSWNNAPPLLEEWTGRDTLLQKITGDWNDPEKHVVGLIGFGGEGKSSVARKWIDNLLNDPSQPQPEGVFWWGFYENRSVDEFFEAVLKWLTGGKKDPQSIPSSSAKAAFIAGMLTTAKRFLFVLDGLEVLQHQDDDRFGLLQNNDLRDFLAYLASPENPSFCLITSRTPMLDLIKYTTYSHKDVEHLSVEDGRELLRKLKVKGDDNQLDKLVKDWDGHALTLSLLAGLLVDQFGGDIQHIPDLPVPTADEPRYDRVHRVLRRYDENLSEAERAFLKLFSVFRLPVEEKSFSKVFRVKWQGENALNTPLAGLSDVEFYRIIGRLADRRILRGDYYNNNYVFTAHPLIRNHYFALFTKGDPSQEKAAHEQIKDYYLTIAGDTPQFPTLDDLKPLIEVVHHACESGAYDEAFNLYWNRISQTTTRVLVHQLGTFETDLSVMLEFFQNGDLTKEPQTSKSDYNRFILNEIGFCLMELGRLRMAEPFYNRYVKGNIEAQDWGNATIGYLNLADLHASLGTLEQSRESAAQALASARHTKDKDHEERATGWYAWVTHLLGRIDNSKEHFSRAEVLEREINPSRTYLYSVGGLMHADHLRRTNQADYSHRVTKANLQICEQHHWPDDISGCHRVLGDLDSDADSHTSARAHYESALKIARSISERAVLIGALLARGRWQAKYMNNANAAFTDLNEALGYCVESGYRIYDADVRVALAWAYLANGEKEKAKQSAERALQMSNEMGYHWGKVDAEEVLRAISG